MNLSIGARIILGFVIALTALLVVGGVSYRNLQELDDDSKEVLRSLDILENKERLTATLAAAQADARGYALSGHEPLAEEFQTESVRMQNVLGQLDALIHDSERRPRLAQLARLLEQRLDVSRRLVQARSESAEAPAGGMADLVREGGDIGVRIRELTLAFEREERDLLERRQARADATAAATASTLLYGTLLAFAFVAIASWLLTRSIRSPLLLLTEGAVRIARGEYQHRVSVLRADEIGALAGVFNEMAEQVEQRQTALAAEDWLKSSLAKFSRLFEGQRDLSVLSRSVLAELAAVLNAPHAAMYTPGAGDENRLHLAASFAAGGLPQTVAPGEGLVGQCWVERQPILVADVPTDYIRIQSALGSAPPSYLAVVPAILDGEVKAVVEAAAFRPLTDLELRFLNQLAESLAIVLNTIEGVRRTDELLRESQALSARLKERQGELAQRNEELETQTERLRQSEQLLQEQQDELKQANEELEQANEELQQANEEMEERSNLLAEQKSELERSNREVEEARQALEGQSQKLALTSRYKSEFLANMSHELRTPLNSLLILSSVLAENAERNLTPKQVQHANTIHESGRDLLALINDILDLSKIEAGAVDVEIDEVRFEALCEAMESTFRPVAESKAVEFRVERDEALPGTMHTDSRRLQQIIKNLLSNALKFTQAGMVELRIYMASGGWSARASSLAAAHRVVAIAVKDSGIGIPQDRQQLIFDAFQQADGSTARKYGGTGLGLSISRQLAQLLGGDLQVQSQPGAGSTFTLYLPCDARVEELERLAEEPARTSPALKTPLSRAAMEDLRFTEAMGFETSATQDDRANLQPADLLLLIIEDDPNFSQVLAQFAREKGFKAVIAHTAASGVALAKRLRPVAITLDLLLPDRNGRVVLDILKHDPALRHIPVHVISVEEERERSLQQGAVSYLQKPVTKQALDKALSDTIDFVTRPVKSLLIVEDDAVQRASLLELIGEEDVMTTAAATAGEALAALETHRFDCVVVDLVLPDMNGLELIREMQSRYAERSPPVIVYTAKALSRKEETELRRLSEAIIVKDVRSPERLLDETALFLHRVQSKLPESKRRLIEQVHREDSALSQRKVLVIDDDVRNIFAITAALETYRMEVLYAESGKAGLELLQSQPDIDAVLMDVMMPEMDGYEATRKIREIDRFRALPIIMVTAKAMKGDREKCLAAGASDYITKPVDMDQLRSLLRVWLYR